MARIVIFLLMGLWVTAAAVAEESRTLRAVFFRAPEQAPAQLYAHWEGGGLVVPLPRMNLSAPLRLPKGDLTIAFSLQAVVSGETPPDLHPLVKIPAGWSDVLLLVSPDPENRGFPLKIDVIDLSLGRLRNGELLWVNHCRARLGGQVGTQKIDLAVGDKCLMSQPAQGEVDYKVAIDWLPPQETKAKPLTRTTWRNETAIRMLVVAVDDPGRNVPRLWSLPIVAGETGGL